MNTLFWAKIRRNPILRAAWMPLLRIRRAIEYRKYQNSEDSRYIKTLKNSCSGERCFIIGNGPSLTREDLSLLVNEKTFAFNRIYQMYQYADWRPTYYMVMDSSIIQKMNQEEEKKLDAEYIFLANKKLTQKYKNQNAHQMFLKGVASVNKKRAIVNQLSEDVSQYFSITQSVTIQAFELAFYMGFKEIYLLGVDHSYTVEIDINGKKHTNKNVVSHFKEDSDKSPCFIYKDALTKEFEICKRYADQHGIKVVNVTRGGKLEVFERDTLEHVLNLH